MQTIEQLNKKFACPKVRFEEGNGGLLKVVVENILCAGEVYLHGAHITQWRPMGHEEVLFMSGRSKFEIGKPIRGGIPICFPAFGPATEPMPMHGFARILDWDVVGVSQQPTGATKVTLELKSIEATKALWPHEFRLSYDVIFGSILWTGLTISNTGSVPFRCQSALHTYLSVGDVTKVHLRGFSLMPYFDKVGGCDATGENGELTITGQTDRVYRTMLGNVVIDPVLRRRIGTTKIGSNHTVVWNPWVEKAKAMSEKPGDFGEDEWQKMLCVEAANAEPLEVGPNNAIGLISELAVSAL